MSYILDALKKSDRERALGNVPTLQTPQEGGTGGRRPWLWAAALVAMLGGGGAFYLLQPDGGDRSEVAVRSPEPEGTESPAAGPPVTAPVDIQLPPPGSISMRLAQRAPRRALAPESVAGPPSQKTIPENDTVPLLQELSPAFQRELPSLTLNVLSYSPDPARRFIMIDFVRYAEGQIIAGGPAIETITADGVVLSYGGTRFLVRP